MSQFLVLTGMGASPFSLRNATQLLAPIAASSQLRRTVNGSLVNISASQFQKFKSTIRGDDQLPPAFNDAWPGLQLTVDCISELSYLTGGAPDRTVVPNSSRIEGAYTFYRPRLIMRVVSFEFDTQEYNAHVAWTLELEEV